MKFHLINDSIITTIQTYKMTTITIITKEQYSEMRASIGTLMFGDDFYECSHYVDLKALKKTLKTKTIPKKVVVRTKTHPEFKNIANEDITYKSPVCCSVGDAGCYIHFIPEVNCGMGFSFPAHNHPLGDAFVVV